MTSTSHYSTNTTCPHTSTAPTMTSSTMTSGGTSSRTTAPTPVIMATTEADTRTVTVTTATTTAMNEATSGLGDIRVTTTAALVIMGNSSDTGLSGVIASQSRYRTTVDRSLTTPTGSCHSIIINLISQGPDLQQILGKFLSLA